MAQDRTLQDVKKILLRFKDFVEHNLPEIVKRRLRRT